MPNTAKEIQNMMSAPHDPGTHGEAGSPEDVENEPLNEVGHEELAQAEPQPGGHTTYTPA